MSNAVFSIKYCTFWVYSAIIYFFPYTIVGDSSRLINDGGYIMLPCDEWFVKGCCFVSTPKSYL